MLKLLRIFLKFAIEVIPQFMLCLFFLVTFVCKFIYHVQYMLRVSRAPFFYCIFIFLFPVHLQMSPVVSINVSR